jgi:ABC-type transport system involved in multi-copper enzyme maturation permease subunit
MVKRVFAIIQNSFREMYRDRFFLILLFGVILFFVISLLLGELSFEEHKKILFDLGISAIHWLNLGLCLFIGGNSLRRELDRQTYMTLLASPLTRIELILGKFGGILAVSIVSTVSLGAGLWILLDSNDSLRNFAAILLGIIVESGVLLALSILLSLLLSPFVAVYSSLSIFLMGHWLESLRHFAERSKNPAYVTFADVMEWLFPNLYRLNWRSVAVLEAGIPANLGLTSLLHALAWMGLFIFLSSVVFKRKNLI